MVDVADYEITTGLAVSYDAASSFVEDIGSAVDAFVKGGGSLDEDVLHSIRTMRVLGLSTLGHDISAYNHHLQTAPITPKVVEEARGQAMSAVSGFSVALSVLFLQLGFTYEALPSQARSLISNKEGFRKLVEHRPIYEAHVRQ